MSSDKLRWIQHCNKHIIMLLIAGATQILIINMLCYYNNIIQNTLQCDVFLKPITHHLMFYMHVYV